MKEVNEIIINKYFTTFLPNLNHESNRCKNLTWF